MSGFPAGPRRRRDQGVAEFRTAARRAEARHHHPALYRHGDRAIGRGLAVRSGQRGILALPRPRGRIGGADGARKRPRLACRPRLVARPQRHQFLLDRHRGGQSGAQPTAIRISPPAQIDAVIALCRDIVGRHSIAPERVLAHSDTAPGRKIDPGEKFPWAQLHAAGVGHYVEPSPIRGGRFLTRRRARRTGRGAAVDAGALRLRRRDHRARSTRPPKRWSPPSSGISGPSGSTASPTARPSRRCIGCWPPCHLT